MFSLHWVLDVKSVVSKIVVVSVEVCSLYIVESVQAGISKSFLRDDKFSIEVFISTDRVEGYSCNNRVMEESDVVRGVSVVVWCNNDSD